MCLLPMMMSIRFSGFDGMAGSQNRHGWAQMPLGAIGECSFDKSLKWALFRASKGRIRSYLYFRRNHDRTTDV